MPQISTTAALFFDGSILFWYAPTRQFSVYIFIALFGKKLSTRLSTSLFSPATKVLSEVTRCVPLAFCLLKQYYPLLRQCSTSVSPDL